MRKHRAGSVWMILPLYLFTLIFVALPLLYVAALSFSTADGGYGVNWKFTLDNYKQILEPVYLQTFTGSFRLALTSTLIICLVGYPFGYFMAKLSEGKKKLAMLFLMLPFWVNSLTVFMAGFHHSPEKGPSELSADEAWHHPGALKNPVQLSCDRDRYDLCIAAVYGTVRIFQCGKAGLVPCGSCQRPWSQQMEGFLERHL